MTSRVGYTKAHFDTGFHPITNLDRSVGDFCVQCGTLCMLLLFLKFADIFQEPLSVAACPGWHQCASCVVVTRDRGKGCDMLALLLPEPVYPSHLHHAGQQPSFLIVSEAQCRLLSEQGCSAVARCVRTECSAVYTQNISSHKRFTSK